MSYRREVDYVIQVSAVIWRDVDVVSESYYANSVEARVETAAKLRSYRQAAPRLTYRAIVRIVEEFPIFPNV